MNMNKLDVILNVVSKLNLLQDTHMTKLCLLTIHRHGKLQPWPCKNQRLPMQI